MNKGTRKIKPRTQWRTVRAIVEVAVHSPDFAPYTDKDLVHDLQHLVGGGQLNRRNRLINYKLLFGTVQVKEALRMLDKLQQIAKNKTEEKITMLEHRLKGLGP